MYVLWSSKENYPQIIPISPSYLYDCAVNKQELRQSQDLALLDLTYKPNLATLKKISQVSATLWCAILLIVIDKWLD